MLGLMIPRLCGHVNSIREIKKKNIKVCQYPLSSPLPFHELTYKLAQLGLVCLVELLKDEGDLT